LPVVPGVKTGAAGSVGIAVGCELAVALPQVGQNFAPGDNGVPHPAQKLFAM